jgi:hypothetical protein
LLSRIRAFFRDIRTWHEDHETAWAQCRTPGHDGLTLFQRDCERRVLAALEARGLSLSNRRIEELRGSGDEDTEPMIVGEIPVLGAKLWIYADQTDITTQTEELRLEEWDTKTPAEHFAAVEEFVLSLPRVEGAA